MLKKYLPFWQESVVRCHEDIFCKEIKIKIKKNEEHRSFKVLCSYALQGKKYSFSLSRLGSPVQQVRDVRQTVPFTDVSKHL